MRVTVPVGQDRQLSLGCACTLRSWMTLPPTLFRHWVNCLCLSGKGNGALPALNGMAFGLRISEAEALQVISDLEKVGLIDRGKDGALSPHNWNGRQYVSDTSTDRVHRFRNKAQDEPMKSHSAAAHGGKRNVSETFHETHQSRADQTRAEVVARTKYVSKTIGGIIGAADELVEHVRRRK